MNRINYVNPEVDLDELYNEQLNQNHYLQEYLAIQSIRERINYHSQLAIINTNIDHHRNNLLISAATVFNFNLTDLAGDLIPKRARNFHPFCHEFLRPNLPPNFRVINENENDIAFKQIVMQADTLFKKIKFHIGYSDIGEELEKLERAIVKYSPLAWTDSTYTEIENIVLQMRLMIMRQVKLEALTETITLYGYEHNPTELEIHNKIARQGKQVEAAPINETARQMIQTREKNRPKKNAIIKEAIQIIHATGRDFKTANNNCQKWLWDHPKIRSIDSGNARGWLDKAIENGIINRKLKELPME